MPAVMAMVIATVTMVKCQYNATLTMSMLYLAVSRPAIFRAMQYNCISTPIARCSADQITSSQIVAAYTLVVGSSCAKYGCASRPAAEATDNMTAASNAP